MHAADAVILIVDDNPINREMLARRIDLLGYMYDFAEDGIQAMDLLNTNEYDLVLLDIMMPHMDGYDVLDAMRHDNKLRDIPVIVISAIDDMQSVIKSIEMGADDFLQKPFNGTLLKARITSCLEKRRLRKAQIERLTELNQLKDQFVSAVSHDLRNPITTIYGYADLLLDGTYPEDVKNIAGRIQRTSTRMLELVTDLLELASIESGIQLQFQKMPLASFVRELISEFEMMASQKNIAIIFKTADSIPDISLDTRRFAQVISNLMTNAIKYTPDGGHIVVSVGEANGSVTIVIEDNGLGIPEKDMPFLFDKFYRVDSVQHKIEKGTGLGLAIVKAVVEAHQGKITVHSVEGQGTTFTVGLPFETTPVTARRRF